jgi:DnaJ-domain-containing protein 1
VLRSGRAGVPRAVELIVSALCDDLLGTYRTARRRRADLAPTDSLTKSLLVRLGARELLVSDFLKGRGSVEARTHGRQIAQRLLEALESGEPDDLVSSILPWELSGEQVRKIAATTDRSQQPFSSSAYGLDDAPHRTSGNVQPDYYVVLGVAYNATGEEIRAAYKTLSQIYHPDRYQSASKVVAEAAAERMVALNGAYECLSDELLRARYDSSMRRP